MAPQEPCCRQRRALHERSSTEFSLAHNVASQQEVDAVMRQAGGAGAKIVKPAQPTFYGGYAGYFKIQMVTCGGCIQPRLASLG